MTVDIRLTSRLRSCRVKNEVSNFVAPAFRNTTTAGRFDPLPPVQNKPYQLGLQERNTLVLLVPASVSNHKNHSKFVMFCSTGIPHSAPVKSSRR